MLHTRFRCAQNDKKLKGIPPKFKQTAVFVQSFDRNGVLSIFLFGPQGYDMVQQIIGLYCECERGKNDEDS